MKPESIRLNLVLQDYWITEKFSSSWIISSNNLEQTLKEIQIFANTILNTTQLPIENNPDFRIIKRENNASNTSLAKYINVAQIRELQNFLYVSSAVSDYKIAVIYEADLMNLNSANCCLKILEETPKDSYIFLITSYPSNIIPTIRSRCIKIVDSASCIDLESSQDFQEFLAIINSTSYNEKLSYIQEITSKDTKDKWQIFTESVLAYIRSLNNPTKFEYIQKLISDTEKFDLDKKHMGILIMENV